MEETKPPVDIFAAKEGEKSKVGVRHLVAVVLAIFLTAIVSVYGIVRLPFFFLTTFGVGALFFIYTINIINAAYFSGWGVIASVMGNLIAFFSVGVSPTQNMVWAGEVFLTTLIFAAAFRRFKIDPHVDDLRTRIAYFLVLLPVSALAGIYIFLVGRVFHLYSGAEFGSGIGEFRNYFLMGMFTYFVMRFISPFIAGSKYFVKKWFA